MPNQHTPYTATETAWLLAHYATATRAQVLAAVPGRQWTAIQKYACKLGASGRPRVIPVAERTVWNPERLQLLRALYPAGGSRAVADATGLSRHAVREQASRLQLRYVKQAVRKLMKPKVKPPVRVPRVKVNPAIVPLRKPDGAPLLAVKRSAGTPNLNLQKEARRQKEEAPKRSALVTADEIKRLPYHHAGRMAYMLHGQAGWQQWKQQQPT